MRLNECKRLSTVLKPSHVVINEMNAVSDHGYAWQGYTGQGFNWANEINFDMNHAPGVESLNEWMNGVLGHNSAL